MQTVEASVREVVAVVLLEFVFFPLIYFTKKQGAEDATRWDDEKWQISTIPTAHVRFRNHPNFS